MTTNYMQVVKMTRDEKIALYMKLNKKQLAEMLVTCNTFIESLTPQVYFENNKK